MQLNEDQKEGLKVLATIVAIALITPWVLFGFFKYIVFIIHFFFDVPQ